MESWRNLLSKPDGEPIVFPWIGERILSLSESVWNLEGRLPPEHGWWAFRCRENRTATWILPKDYNLRMTEDQVANFRTFQMPGILKNIQRGYLVGDRFFGEQVTKGELDPVVDCAFPSCSPG